MAKKEEEPVIGAIEPIGPIPGAREYNLKDYRAAIRSLWLPIVARKKFNGAEVRFIMALWKKGEPIELVIQAIKAIDERRRRTTLVPHSLGIIRSDLEALKIKRSRTHVGGKATGNREQVTDGDWRAEYAEALDELAENDRPRAAHYLELKRDLPTLISKAAADAHFRRIR